MRPSLGLVVVAAGASSRMGGVDKVWAPLGGHPVIWHALDRLGPAAQRVVVVVRPEQIDRARQELSNLVPDLCVVSGGAERQESVAHGLAAIGEVEAVAVHDAARPLAPPRLLEIGIEALRRSDGAIPAEPVRDTIKRIATDGSVIATVDRAMLRAAQTPQLFWSRTLRAAHAVAGSRQATDDAALLEAAGYQVCTFPGVPYNFKITTPFDLALAEMLLQRGGVP